MALSSDTLHPSLNEPFRVTVSIRVKENVASLPNVYLPSFFGPEELGDERSYTHGPDGTLYRETLTLEAHSSGPVHITPARMDAIDARDGKPKRFSSNDLTLYVGSALPGPWAAVRWIAAIVLYGGLAVAAGFVIIAIFVRRAPRDVKQLEPEPDPLPEPDTAQTAIDAAVQRLRERRDRASVLHVRARLWESAGAGEGETLHDVLRRLSSAAEERRQAAIRIEHAAFIDDARLQPAIGEFLNGYERSAFA